MILTGTKIESEQQQGRVKIDPFRLEHINTNSYDLCLGNTYLRYTTDLIDPAVSNPYEIVPITDAGLLLESGSFVLASTQEKIGSNFFVPILHAKSSIARSGLFVHVTADLIDIGSYGHLTLQLFATLPIRLYAGMRIAQVSFWNCEGDIELYDGKYNYSHGPQASKSWKDPFFFNMQSTCLNHQVDNAR